MSKYFSAMLLDDLPDDYSVIFDHLYDDYFADVLLPEASSKKSEKKNTAPKANATSPVSAASPLLAAEARAQYLGGSGDPPSEALLQAIWARRLLDDELVTETGRRVTLREPGEWNAGAGPDFLQAEFDLDGIPVRGAVELHIRASGWREHGHERDFEYNRAVLHVYWENDDGHRYDRLQNGEKMERVCMRGHIPGGLEAVRAALDPEQLMPGSLDRDATPPPEPACRGAFARLEIQDLEKFFDLAARERMEKKVGRLAGHSGINTSNNQAAKTKPDTYELNDAIEEAIYRSLAIYLGQGATKPLFYLVARRLPPSVWRPMLQKWPERERAPRLFALFLGVAGLLSTKVESPKTKKHNEKEIAAAHGQSIAYHAELTRYWEETKSDPELGAGLRTMAPTRRWKGGVRPANFPERLLAGWVQLILRWEAEGGLLASLARQLPATEAETRHLNRRQLQRYAKSLVEWLEVEAPDNYWAIHYSFNSYPTDKPMKLLGPSRAKVMAFNALLPGLIYAGRSGWGSERLNSKEGSGKGRGLPAKRVEELAWKLYHVWPPLAETSITRFMQQRLFGKEGPLDSSLLRHEARRQALYQIYEDCCSKSLPLMGQCGMLGS